MKKSYLFLADGFEEIEALTVVDILRRAEMPLVTLSVTDKAVVTGAHGIPVVADALAQDVSFDEVEWLILPGGMPGMTNLAASRPLCDLVKAHAEAGGLKNRRVHDLGQGVLIVAALHHNGFPNPYHSSTPPASCNISSSSSR